MPRIPINMPKMSMTMEEGTIVEWLFEVGATVRNGDTLAVVTTDKVDMEVESTSDGTLAEIVAGPGAVVPVGQPMGWIDSEKADLLGDLFAGSPPQSGGPQPPETAETPEKPEEPAAQTAAAANEPQAAPATGKVRAVPLARKLAAEAGIDLSQLAASGPSHTIRARDVRDAIAAQAGTTTPAPSAAPAQAAAPAPVPAGTGELLGDSKQRRMRVATARVMAASTQVPQFTVYRVLDLSLLARGRKAGLRGVSWTSILLRAYALVLREYPNLNGHWEEQGVRGNEQVGVALAIDTPTGLLAPVVSEPDRIALRALDARVKELAEQVKGGNVAPDLFAGATGTLSNLGGWGVDRFNALLTVPQATALSVGAVGPRPFFDETGTVVGKVACEVGLTVDHRAADGADAARALQTLQDLLADPIALLA